MDNGILLNFGKRYEDDLRVIFDQWQKLHLGLDALSNQEILKGIYCTGIQTDDNDPCFFDICSLKKLKKNF
jgi:hypothetical protein